MYFFFFNVTQNGNYTNFTQKQDLSTDINERLQDELDFFPLSKKPSKLHFFVNACEQVW